jgi:hypothetical protein
MKKGFRESKMPSKKQQIEESQNIINDIQKGLQLMRMMMVSMNKSIQGFNADLNNTMTMMNDLQYRTLAMVKAKTFDEETLNRVAMELKIEDYERISSKDDADRGLIDAAVVSENSIVVFTSATPGQTEDKGILRTKIPVNQSPSQQFKEAIIGKEVGGFFQTTIDGINHDVTILKIKELPPKAEVVEA